MKTHRVMAILVLLAVLVSGCARGAALSATSPAPEPTGPRMEVPVLPGELPTSPTPSPDDLLPTPGGYAYRGNVHQAGTKNPYPSIEIVTTSISSGLDKVMVDYRRDIQTARGEVRNDIVNLRKPGAGLENSSARLYLRDGPAGWILGQITGVGLPLTLAPVLSIRIPLDAASGDYDFFIGVTIDGKDYGTLPCRVIVEGSDKLPPSVGPTPTATQAITVGGVRVDNGVFIYFHGTADFPDGTLLLTLLSEVTRIEQPRLLPWWPTTQTVTVEGGEWEISVPLSVNGAPDRLPINGIYRFEIWKRDDPLVSRIFMFDTIPPPTTDPSLLPEPLRPKEP